MRKRKPTYHTPLDFICPHCGDASQIIPDLTDFDHEFGTEYPAGWGSPVCSNCEGRVEAEKEEDLEW